MQIVIQGVEYGHIRITNDGEIKSIWINQPWGGELFFPEAGYREEK